MRMEDLVKYKFQGILVSLQGGKLSYVDALIRDGEPGYHLESQDIPIHSAHPRERTTKDPVLMAGIACALSDSALLLAIRRHEGETQI